MAIRRKFLDQIRSIPGLRLPAILQVYDSKGGFVDHVILWVDGRVDASTGCYEHPSAFRATFDPDVTPELIRAINKYQDLYINEHITKM